MGQLVLCCVGRTGLSLWIALVSPICELLVEFCYQMYQSEIDDDSNKERHGSIAVWI